MAGEVYFEDPYAGNCLVNAMTVGLVKHDEIIRSSAAGVGNHVVLIGSKTGRDGIGGASVLASQVFDETLEEKRPSVQVGDPFTEKKLLEACLELLRADLLVALQDLGAAGITSSSSEMAAKGEVGIDLHADRVPLREADMEPWEIMISESQERMLAIVAPEQVGGRQGGLRRWDLDATIVGEVTDTKHLRVFFGGEMVGDMDADGPGRAALLRHPAGAAGARGGRARRSGRRTRARTAALEDILLDLIGSPNIASRRWVWQQYDHQVQLNTVIVPGGDAALLRIKKTGAGIAVCTDGNGRQTYLDPYRGGKAAVAEAARNVSCVGAKPIAITNCLNFGNPGQRSHRVPAGPGDRGHGRSLRGLGDAGHLRATSRSTTRASSSPSTRPPVVGMLGLMDDVTRQLHHRPSRTTGDVVLPARATRRRSLDGSEYQKRWFGGRRAGRPGGYPTWTSTAEVALQRLLQQAIAARLLRSAHDCSDGGLAVALAESCVAGEHRRRPGLRPPALDGARAAPGALAGCPAGHRLLRRDPHAGGRVRRRGRRGRASRRLCESAASPATHLGTSGGTELAMTAEARWGTSRPALQRAGRRACEEVYESALPRAMGDIDAAPAHPGGGASFPDWLPDDSPHDECGVFAIYAPEMDVARLTFFALFALQHRGQESAGIAVTDGARLIVHKDMGLVSQVFEEAILQTLPGQLAIGHVRYSTTGASEMRNAQPFARTRNGSFIALAHNGNLVNTDELRAGLVRERPRLREHLRHRGHRRPAGRAPLPRHPRAPCGTSSPGCAAPSARCCSPSDEVIGFRDPYGIRPLVLGQARGPLLPGQRVVGAGHHRAPSWSARSSRARSAGSTRTATTSSRWSTASARRSASSSSSTSPAPTR